MKKPISRLRISGYFSGLSHWAVMLQGSVRIEPFPGNDNFVVVDDYAGCMTLDRRKMIGPLLLETEEAMTSYKVELEIHSTYSKDQLTKVVSELVGPMAVKIEVHEKEEMPDIDG